MVFERNQNPRNKIRFVSAKNAAINGKKCRRSRSTISKEQQERKVSEQATVQPTGTAEPMTGLKVWSPPVLVEERPASRTLP